MVGDFDGLFEDGEETVDAIARRIVIVGIARGAITAVFRVKHWCVELDWIGLWYYVVPLVGLMCGVE